jgi:hypothetical protein
VGSTNRSFSSASASATASLCYWRRRWTGPEEVCVPRASTTATSPHAAAAASCNPGLAASFGLSRVAWPAAAPCNDGIDNDADGRIDYPADSDCRDASDVEQRSGCGLGAELVPALAWLTRRFRRSASRVPARPASTARGA